MANNKFSQLANLMMQGAHNITDSQLSGSSVPVGSDNQIKLNTLVAEVCLDGKEIEILYSYLKRAYPDDDFKAKYLVGLILDNVIWFYWQLFSKRARNVSKVVIRNFKQAKLSDTDPDDLLGNNDAAKIVAEGVDQIASIINIKTDSERVSQLSLFGDLFEEYRKLIGQHHFTYSYWQSILNACKTLNDKIEIIAKDNRLKIVSARSKELESTFYEIVMDPIFNAISEYQGDLDKYIQTSKKGGALYLNNDEKIKKGDLEFQNSDIYTEPSAGFENMISNLFALKPLTNTKVSGDFADKYNEARKSLRQIKGALSSKWKDLSEQDVSNSDT